MSEISETRTVAYEGAEAVRAKVAMASGSLSVSGGAEALMEGTFAYADPKWKPIVAYDVENGVGTLKVKQPKIEGPHVAGPHYVWDLAMGNEAPLSFAVKLASGSADLRMADTRLSELNVKVASGSVKADLTGDQAELTQVFLKSASGRSSLVMDGAYPVLGTVDLGTASGPTDVRLPGDYPALRELKIGSASGRVRVVLSGTYPVLEKVSVKLASGSVDLDVSGLVLPCGEISVSCVSGKATVTVPGDSAVAIRFSAVSGKLVAPGFHKEGKEYVNAAYTAATAEDGAEGVLHLSMSTVSGKLVVHSPEA